MGIQQDTESGIEGVLTEAWVITKGTVVPATEDVTLKNGGRLVQATYLYTDLANSSLLAQTIDDKVVAKVIRTYLNAATRLLKHFGGEIRSFDGDRVTAIYLGGSKNTSAVSAAFALNWAVKQVIRVKLNKKWPTTLANYTMHHGVGIDTGEALIVRGGVRNNNDLVSIGAAPNVAAKLSDLRDKPGIYITDRVFRNMDDSVKRGLKDTSDVWTKQNSKKIGGKSVAVYGSEYWRRPGA